MYSYMDSANYLVALCTRIHIHTYGTTKFLHFLDIMSEDSVLSAADITYYKSCINVVFDRQIGSRYFFTATNKVKFYT